MDRIDDFSWMLDEIDNTLIFMLRDGLEMLGSYQVNSLKMNGMDPVNVRFANIADLNNFVSYATIRFNDSINKDNIIDIPVRKMIDLYKASSEVTEGVPKGISLNELETFSVYNGKIIKDGYALYGYKIGEVSDDLMEIMKIANKYNEMDMNKKIDALEDINLINYQHEKNNNKSR